MMKVTDFIGEATEYDKKEMLEERKPRIWLKSVSALCKWHWWNIDFRCVR